MEKPSDRLRSLAIACDGYQITANRGKLDLFYAFSECGVFIRAGASFLFCQFGQKLLSDFTALRKSVRANSKARL